MDGSGDTSQTLKDFHKAIVDGDVPKISALLKTGKITVDEPDDVS